MRTKFIQEGIDIDQAGREVYVNPEHNEVINTNEREHSTIFKSHKMPPRRLERMDSCLANGFDVYSIFNRGLNSCDFLNALKQRRGWKLGNPEDLNVLLMNAVYAIRNNPYIFNPENYDVFVMCPSSNQLNKTCFDYLSRMFPNKMYCSNLFQKLKAETVWKQLDWSLIENYYGDQPEKVLLIHDKLKKAFHKMIESNNGLFSYKYIMPLSLRKFVVNSIKVSGGYGYTNKLKGKRILVFDDIVASGNTMEDVALQLDKFNPAKIDFLTLFSNKKATKNLDYNPHRWLLGANMRKATHKYLPPTPDRHTIDKNPNIQVQADTHTKYNQDSDIQQAYQNGSMQTNVTVNPDTFNQGTTRKPTVQPAKKKSAVQAESIISNIVLTEIRRVLGTLLV